MASYSQFTAFKALAAAALRALLRSPSSVIFTLAFPLVFVVGFGFLGNGKKQQYQLGILSSMDANTAFYQSLKNEPLFNLVPIDSDGLESAIQKELADAVLFEEPGDSAKYVLSGSSYNANDMKIIQLILDEHLAPPTKAGSISQSYISTHKNKPIDFILTGQLGFAMLAASVFGVAFSFFGLRQELVLKRFFATPIKRWNILLAEGFSRMLFQLVSAALLIIIGYYVFDFTLSEGVWTVIKLVLVAGIGVLMFMSFGFVISGLAKSNSAVPPLANMLVLPQFILAGTFVPIHKFPEWMQWIAKLLPLTYMNEAFRKVAVAGAGIWDIKLEIMVLTIWGIIGYTLASRLFKWE